MSDLKDKRIGFIGLGAMGSRMAANLVKAGYRVRGFDIRAEARAAHVAAGGEPAADAAEAVRESEIVCTSLVSPAYLEVAEAVLLPSARAGQVFIDHSTIPAPDARRLAAEFAAKGAAAIDAPVSGWWTGARDGTLRIFIGGDEKTVGECRPLFEVIGDPAETHYAGSAGMGQVMKVVQQLTVRMLDAARLEVMAFGVRGGLTLEQVMKGLKVDPASDDGYARLYRIIKAGKADELACLFGEWEYYIEEAKASGFRMPMLEAMHRMGAAGEMVNRDEQGRRGPSVWRELMRAEPDPAGGG